MAFDVNLAAQGLLSIVKAQLSKKSQVPVVDESEVEAAIAHHLSFVDAWSCQVPFPASPGGRALSDVFVHLPLSLVPKRQRLERSALLSGDTTDLFRSSDHAVILGDPGAGKSTVVKRICQQLIHEEPTHGADRCSFPIVLRCRDIGDHTGLYTWILETLGVRVRRDRRSELRKLETVVVEFIEDNEVFVLVDGLDEAPPELRHCLIGQFQMLIHSVHSGRLLLTCRSGAFEYNVEGADVLEIAPLDAELISRFLERWLPDEKKREAFRLQMLKSPYADTTVRPLTLVHLCALYEVYGSIPDRPRTVYRKIVYLLLEEWDRANLLQRTSQYARFGPDRKAEFLAAFAYAATINGYRGHFSMDALKEIYEGICTDFELPSDEARQVAEEIESHAGLIVQSGFQEYEITHLSIQEYLCADYLVRGQINELPDRYVMKLPDEIAIATALSSSASDFFVRIVLRCTSVTGGQREGFWKQYMSRLIVERPDFAACSALGVGCLYVLSILEYAKMLEECADLLAAFFRIEAIRESLKRVPEACRVERVDKAHFEVYPPPDMLPEAALREGRLSVPVRSLPPRVFQGVRRQMN
jgi:hypothetical protein